MAELCQVASNTIHRSFATLLPACICCKVPRNVKIPLWGQICMQKQHVALGAMLHHCVSSEFFPAEALIWAA